MKYYTGWTALWRITLIIWSWCSDTVVDLPIGRFSSLCFGLVKHFLPLVSVVSSNLAQLTFFNAAIKIAAICEDMCISNEGMFSLGWRAGPQWTLVNWSQDLPLTTENDNTLLWNITHFFIFNYYYFFRTGKVKNPK